MDKLAELGKSAKFYEDMTPTEKIRADKIEAKRRRQEDANTPKRDAWEAPDTSFIGGWKQTINNTPKYLKSLGVGAKSTAKTLGWRAGQGLINYATFMPAMIDDFVLGGLMGVDEGRGLTGRYRGEMDRWFDKQVDAARRESSDYDYTHRIGGLTSSINRGASGVGADAVGKFIGFGGLHGLASKGLFGKALGVGFGGLGVKEVFNDDSAEKQLRDREAWIRRKNPVNWQYMDATSTAHNRQHAPTREEYRRYHIPQALPTSWRGRVQIPYAWAHMANGQPTQFREYGM